MGGESTHKLKWAIYVPKLQFTTPLLPSLLLGTWEYWLCLLLKLCQYLVCCFLLICSWQWWAKNDAGSNQRQMSEIDRLINHIDEMNMIKLINLEFYPWLENSSILARLLYSLCHFLNLWLCHLILFPIWNPNFRQISFHFQTLEKWTRIRFGGKVNVNEEY